MARTADNTPKALKRGDFKQLIVRAIALPVLLVLGFSAALVWQISNLIDTMNWVEHTDLAITRANELQRLHVDMETGVRGYLLTGDRSFLEPYQRAGSRINAEYDSLYDFMAPNPAQQELLKNNRSLKNEWLDFAEGIMELRQSGKAWDKALKEKVGKRLMDKIRAGFQEFIGAEELLRDQRSARAREVAGVTIVMICLLTLVVGGVLAWLSKRQFSALAATYESALAVADELTAHLERRVEERTAQLAEANRELEAFSYSVSHDLRAPMRHISGFANLLQRSLAESLNADDRENLTIIGDTASRAGVMVDELLAFSRVGRIELHKQRINTLEVVEHVRRELTHEIGNREIRWKIGHLPALKADPTLLRLVFQNLISNAVKYTRGQPHAEIEIAAEHAPRQVKLLVRDNGVGFDMRYADKLFGVFSRLHRSEDFEGTGIGLANVRRIIERHGGQVGAEGIVNRGATFWFTLPSESSQVTDGHQKDSAG